MNFFWRVVRTIPASSSTPARYASTNAAYKITGRQARPRALTVLQPQAQQQQPPPQQSQPPPDASSASPASASVFGETLNVLDAIAADQEKLKAVEMNEIEYLGLRPGEIYSPFGLEKNARVVKRTRRKRLPRTGPGTEEAAMKDPFLFYNIDPVKEALNSHLLNAFLTTMGKIRGRNETMLPRRTQRRMGKAIRRARNLGILPNMVRAALSSSRFDASAVLNRPDVTIAEGSKSR